jgi:hypothetical protein
MDSILDGIQQRLDTEGEGWQAAHYVVVIGLERITGDGVEHHSCMYNAANQPDYITTGLLDKADEMSTADVED